MKDIYIRPLTDPNDVILLDRLRREYHFGDLELPHDFNTPDGAVETAVATKNGRTIGSLTAIRSVVLDPFIKDPSISPSDLIMALLKLETALTFNAQKFGAVDAYLAVPLSESKYIRLLENHGWQQTVQNCVVMRRPLRPDTVPLIGPERDKQALESSPATPPE